VVAHFVVDEEVELVARELAVLGLEKMQQNRNQYSQKPVRELSAGEPTSFSSCDIFGQFITQANRISNALEPAPAGQDDSRQVTTERRKTITGERAVEREDVSERLVSLNGRRLDVLDDLARSRSRVRDRLCRSRRSQAATKSGTCVCPFCSSEIRNCSVQCTFGSRPATAIITTARGQRSICEIGGQSRDGKKLLYRA
jgi:hypothetical protein